MKHVKTFFSKLTFAKLILLIALPSAVLLLGLFISSVSYKKHNTELIANTYYNESMIFTSETDTRIENIIFNAKQLADKNSFLETINGIANYNTQKNTVSIISNFVRSNSLVHSAAIVDLSSYTVTSNSGIDTLSDYFRDYDYFSDTYWSNYTPIYNYTQILSPQLLTLSETNTAPIITAIISPWGEVSNNSVFIVNMNIDKILLNFNNYILTDNTCIFLIDKTKKRLFASTTTNDNLTQEINNPIFITTLLKDKNYIHSENINSEDWLFVKSLPHISSQSYSYLIAVPYSDIYASIPRLETYIVALLMFLISISTILIYGNAKVAYTPISRMERLLSETLKNMSHLDKNIHISENEYIDDAINNILSDRNDYKIALTILKERFLNDILFHQKNQTILDINQETFFQTKVTFSYDYFLVVAFCFNSKSDNMAFDHNINEIRSAIRNAFPAEYDLFLIKEPHKDLYYMALNFSNPNCRHEIDEYFKQFQSTFNEKSKYIHLTYSIGEVCLHIDSLNYSYNEAKNLLLKTQSILTDKKITNIQFTDNDETILLNYLLSGHIDKAQAFILKFIDCFDDYYTTEDRVNCTTSIMSVIFKVMYAKNLSYETEKYINESDAIASFSTYQTSDFKKLVINYLSKLQTCFSVREAKVNIKEIIDYINQNYHQTLSLDILADMYSTNASYLSRSIKQHLGENFLTYLSNLRISKAQELLTTTNKPINDIISEVGFVSRTSFLRAFKNHCGITPSEYRRIEKDRKKIN